MIFFPHLIKIPLRPSSSPKDVIPAQKDHRAWFYEDYHNVAEEYDKDFLKKHDEDLNTTLIFESCKGTFDELALTKGTGQSRCWD